MLPAARLRFVSWLQLAYRWKLQIVGFALWYAGLIYFRDILEMGDVFLLLSGFLLIGLVGFTPRKPGELSAYSHMNENHERILGSMDPARAGGELTGMAAFDYVFAAAEQNRFPSETSSSFERVPSGFVLGDGSMGSIVDESDGDADLQRALLLSLREERERRKKR